MIFTVFWTANCSCPKAGRTIVTAVAKPGFQTRWYIVRSPKLHWNSTTVREPTGLVHLGLFSDGGPVRREQFTDGLSQTIIIGEIRDAFPPWGEPGNVRSIGEGLNRQFRGFGNEAGTGATFLHADGSAKFYSNKTDKRVLQRLETRDGAEPE